MATAKHKMFLLEQIVKQKKWIEDCEANGVSYANAERGMLIRQADTNELYRLEKELRIATA